MTIDEKMAISNKAFRLMDAGDEESCIRLMKTAPYFENKRFLKVEASKKALSSKSVACGKIQN